MTESASALSSWEGFYAIVGTSGGALIGLRFVGIRNAWDTVTHIVVSSSGGGSTKAD